MKKLLGLGLLIIFWAGCTDNTTQAPDNTDISSTESTLGQKPFESDTLNLPPDDGSNPEDGTPSLKGSFVEIKTNLGKMVVMLYDDTPGHRDNFVKLVNEGFYDGTAFHRVMQGFMIQGGDPKSKTDKNPSNDGTGGPGYDLPAEFRPNRFHKRGALGAASDGNPQKNSNGSQFYIVQGNGPIPDDTILNSMREQGRQMSGNATFDFSPEARKVYKEIGGAPALDMNYTVFGELVEGFDVLDKIAGLETARKRKDPNSTLPPDYPPNINDVRMTMKILPDYKVNS